MGTISFGAGGNLSSGGSGGGYPTNYATFSALPASVTDGAWAEVDGVSYRYFEGAGCWIPSEWWSESRALVQSAASDDCSLTTADDTTSLAAANFTLTNVYELSGGGITLDSVGSVQSRISFGEEAGAGVTWPAQMGLILQVDSTSQNAGTMRPELRIRNGTKRLEVTFGLDDTLNNVGFLNGLNTAHAEAKGALQAASFETLFLEIDWSSGGLAKVWGTASAGEVVLAYDDFNADASAAYIAFFTGSTNGDETVEVRRMQAVDLT